ncbi:unnamed protein product [Tilletia controversa]|uniref:Uncharacterized protein n=3 Tax=Tilletia TaxID=13289 RepID=A0A8X7SW44_9BASI|nr:hypothetical protein CF328_g4112 [Tilletia controversa]KAE8196780.1 hypothetical protein CF336_g2470 [Tilletia laevis]KAE8262877.1 hypothetical protein A4X03_0g2111 [Tilletia caries]KAE8206426.1 hypothetical protein CF335_g1898 [Tilletia laevis]KAE8246886.1 hypothetical protein A4X06_0g4838 [Tilletia controversa]
MPEGPPKAKKARPSSVKPSRATSEEVPGATLEIPSRYEVKPVPAPEQAASEHTIHPRTANKNPASAMNNNVDLNLPSELEGQPLSVVAWCRIIDRAQRGIGDASYNSDDDDVAQEEAADERPRGELTRVVRCLHSLRTAGIAKESSNIPLASEEALSLAKARLLMPTRQ